MLQILAMACEVQPLLHHFSQKNNEAAVQMLGQCDLSREGQRDDQS